MLINTGNQVVNTDHIVSAEYVFKSGSKDQWVVTLTNGKTVPMGSAVPALDEICGVTIPAPAGLVLIEAYAPDADAPEKGVTYLRSTVIAFRIEPGTDNPTPVGLRGEPSASLHQDYAVLQTDGRCFGWDEAWDTLEEFEAHCRGLQPRG